MRKTPKLSTPFEELESLKLLNKWQNQKLSERPEMSTRQQTRTVVKLAVLAPQISNFFLMELFDGQILTFDGQK